MDSGLQDMAATLLKLHRDVELAPVPSVHRRESVMFRCTSSVARQIPDPECAIVDGIVNQRFQPPMAKNLVGIGAGWEQGRHSHSK